jgi:dUTP pyrophosphatase
MHPNFILPTRGSASAGGWDVIMPEAGVASPTSQLVGLGFAAAVPPGHVALLLPRSGVGAKYGVELNNTCGVIDADYRGEWLAALKTKAGSFAWQAGERVLQFVVVPVAVILPVLVATLPGTVRGSGGLGSTGK